MDDPLNTKAKCLSCGSRQLLRADYLATGAMGAGMSVTVKVPLGGRRTLLKKSRIAADVCLDCGVIHFRATEVTRLREASTAVAGLTKVKRL